ncbi:hypothetical protein RZO50_03865 [Microbacterium sp. SSW1-59]|uniref:hypothetical protein n=1 Tax=Microbacterium xanthum TaxID=3079794 RepID=UPI002AD2DDDF|nr:hypothetical protein [Microbacterium sp. SSW1-59]MDZ8200634.1 hypothetical protein [Microbacterium sp. SSW1-59]
MQFRVKVLCHGAGNYQHKPRTVAQFRYDEGWARVHNEGPMDPLVWLPTGDVSQRHALICDRCTRTDYYTPERLYPLLDELRSGDRPTVDARQLAQAAK